MQQTSTYKPRHTDEINQCIHIHEFIYIQIKIYIYIIIIIIIKIYIYNNNKDICVCAMIQIPERQSIEKSSLIGPSVSLSFSGPTGNTTGADWSVGVPLL